MTENKWPEKVGISITNLQQAFSRLELFLEKPIEDERDQAGVIQAFEFTYELFWKTFQKIAQSQGLQAQSPKQALQAAFQLDFVHAEEEQLWLEIMEDRNRTVHTYQKELAQQIFERIRDQYFEAFGKCLGRLVD